MIGLRLFAKGVPQLARALQDIDKKIARKALRQAVNESLKPVLADAKKAVATDTKLLKKSLGKKTKSFRSGQVMVGVVGVRKQMKGKKGSKERTAKFRVQVGVNSKGEAIWMDPIKYAHMVEFGTKPHTIGRGDKLKRKGRKHKQVQAGFKHPGSKKKPFLRPSLSKNKSGTKSTMRRVLGDALTKAKRR